MLSDSGSIASHVESPLPPRRKLGSTSAGNAPGNAGPRANES
jgi:hypothetical protein